MEVLVPMANLIDKDEEIARLSKEVENSTRKSPDSTANSATTASSRKPLKKWSKKNATNSKTPATTASALDDQLERSAPSNSAYRG